MTAWSSISDDTDGAIVAGMIASVGILVLCLVMVGRAVATRQRSGQPMARYAMIWAAIVALGFAAALTIDRHAG